MDKVSLHRELWGKQFNSPIMLASGTAGFGLELLKMNYLEGVAAVISKAVTPEHRPGNPPPRIAETEFGLLNSIGLANPGVDEIIETVLCFSNESLQTLRQYCILHCLIHERHRNRCTF